MTKETVSANINDLMAHSELMVRCDLQPSRARAVHAGENDVIVVLCGPPCGMHTQGLEADILASEVFVRSNMVSTGWQSGMGIIDVWTVPSFLLT